MNKENINKFNDIDNISNSNESLNDVSLNLVKKMFKKCVCSAWLHQEAQSYYQRLSYYIGFPQIIINSILAVVNTQSQGNLKLTYFVTSFLLINSIISSLKEYVKFDRRVEYHKRLSTDYTILSNKLENLFNQKDISNLSKLKDEYDNLLTINESLIPHKIIKKSEKIFGHKNIPIIAIQENSYDNEHHSEEFNTPKFPSISSNLFSYQHTSLKHNDQRSRSEGMKKNNDIPSIITSDNRKLNKNNINSLNNPIGYITKEQSLNEKNNDILSDNHKLDKNNSIEYIKKEQPLNEKQNNSSNQILNSTHDDLNDKQFIIISEN